MKNIRLVKSQGPVVHLNRSKKAQMIESVIQSFIGQPVKGFRILDIGCGNGGICSQFMNDNNVSGVDIEDLRKIKKGFTFKLVDSATLPFGDNLFDIIISNHTIEHIPDQKLHLKEIRRVLKPTGLVYLATPNKSSPLMRGHIGNPHVLRWREMAPLFKEQGFIPYEQGIKLLKDPYRYGVEFPYARWLPRFILKPLRPLFASHIYILKLQA